jgi:hypothetical protein
MAQLIRRHPLVTLFVLAYGLTWAIQIPRAAGVLEGGGWWAVTYAPAIAALLAAALTGGRPAVRELEGVMNLAEKRHQDADCSINSVSCRPPFSALASDS